MEKAALRAASFVRVRSIGESAAEIAVAQSHLQIVEELVGITVSFDDKGRYLRFILELIERDDLRDGSVNRLSVDRDYDISNTHALPIGIATTFDSANLHHLEYGSWQIKVRPKFTPLQSA